MATAALTAGNTATSSTKKVVWSWQSNLEPWNAKQTKEWQRYSDLVNEVIEDAFQKKEQDVQLGDYIIDFKKMVQFNKRDRHKQRPVKREAADVTQYLREERFCFPEKPTKSFGDAWAMYSELIDEWKSRNSELVEYRYYYPDIVEQAAKGILKEGILINQEFQAQEMANQLRNVKNKSKEEIHERCARLYSAESFLYKLVNAALRNEEDTSKVDTLGAYCWLLNEHLPNPRSKKVPEIVYRGTNLTDEMIEEYKQAIGTRIRWLAFSSTSKDRRQAEQFGNTLFLINLKGMLPEYQSDISSLSYYPHEQEILIYAGRTFKVVNVECDVKTGKYFIYLTAL